MNIIKEMLNLPDTPSGKKKLNKLITKLGLGKKQKGDIIKSVVNGDISNGEQIFDYIYFRDFYINDGEIILPVRDLLQHIFNDELGINNIYLYTKMLVHFRANPDAKFEKIIASNDSHSLDENYTANRIAKIPYYIGIPKYIFRTPIDKIDVLESLKIGDIETYNSLIQIKVDEKDIYSNNFKMHYYTIQNYVDFINECKELKNSAAITLSDLMNPAFVCYRMLYGYDTWHYNSISTIDKTIDFTTLRISLIAYTDITIVDPSMSETYFGSPLETISKYIEYCNKNNNEEHAKYVEEILNIFKKYFVELSEEEYFRILTENCKS